MSFLAGSMSDVEPNRSDVASNGSDIDPFAKWAEVATPEEIENTMKQCSELELRNRELTKQLHESETAAVATAKKDKARIHALEARVEELRGAYRDVLTRHESELNRSRAEYFRLEDELVAAQKRLGDARREVARLTELLQKLSLVDPAASPEDRELVRKAREEQAQKTKEELAMRDRLVTGLKTKIAEMETRIVDSRHASMKAAGQLLARKEQRLETLDKRWKARVAELEEQLDDREKLATGLEADVERLEKKMGEKEEKLARVSDLMKQQDADAKVLGDKLLKAQMRNTALEKEVKEVSTHLDFYTHAKNAIEDDAANRVRGLEKQLMERIKKGLTL